MPQVLLRSRKSAVGVGAAAALFAASVFAQLPTWFAWGLFGVGFLVLVGSILETQGVVPPKWFWSRLEGEARRWAHGPRLHPDPDRFPHGQALVQDAFERRGSTPPLTTDATKYLLLLSIQWGENWCYWYWHAQDLPDLIDTLVIAWHRPSWVRVSGRVAHLLQKHPWQEVEAAIARELGDRLPPELESWVEAVRERRVFEFVEEVQRHSRKVDEWSLLLTELREVDC